MRDEEYMTSEDYIASIYNILAKKELIKIKKTLATIGYFPYKVTSILGTDHIVIEARGYDKDDDALIAREEAAL